MKPILACDYDESKANYPYMGFPKIDGVRALNIMSRLVGRSGKQFKNRLNTEFFSKEEFLHLDGEMVVDQITGYNICNRTTSALGTIKGDIETRWCLFDLMPTEGELYLERYEMLLERVDRLHADDSSLASRIWVIPYKMLHCHEDLEMYETEQLELGFEGVILRDPNGIYKQGRATPKEANYLRLKRFMDTEIVVTRIEEGSSNNNALQRTPNGYAERSTHAANMVPNGMIGTIYGIARETKMFWDRAVITKGDEVEVAPGKMSHSERKYYLENPEQIMGRTGKFQFFPVGIKDKPRFPTWQGFRDEVDL